jgi:hypothetical protein
MQSFFTFKLLTRKICAANRHALSVVALEKRLDVVVAEQQRRRAAGLFAMLLKDKQTLSQQFRHRTPSPVHKRPSKSEDAYLQALARCKRMLLFAVNGDLYAMVIGYARETRLRLRRAGARY